MNRCARVVAGLFLATAMPGASTGHHTFAYDYNTSQVAEIVGEVIEVQWENPHIRLRVRTGNGEVWSIESNSPAGMQRRTVYPDMVGVGSRLRLAGFPARNGGNAMHASNILLGDGREVVLRPGSQRRWEDASATTQSP